MKGGQEFPADSTKFSSLTGEPGDQITQLYEVFKSVTHAMNQHAVILNKLNAKSQDFVEHSELRGALDKIEGAISLYDNEFLNQLEIKCK